MNFITKFFNQINGLDFLIKGKNNENIEIYFFEGNNAALCIEKKSNKVLYKIDYDKLEIGLSNKNGLTFNIDGFIVNLVLKEKGLIDKNNYVSNILETNSNKKYDSNQNNFSNKNKNTMQNQNRSGKNNTQQKINNNFNSNQNNQNQFNNNQSNQTNSNQDNTENKTNNKIQKIVDPIMQNSVLQCKYPYMFTCNSCQNKKCSQYDMLHKREDLNLGKGPISEDVYEQYNNYCKNKMEKFKCNNTIE